MAIAPNTHPANKIALRVISPTRDALVSFRETHAQAIKKLRLIHAWMVSATVSAKARTVTLTHDGAWYPERAPLDCYH